MSCLRTALGACLAALLVVAVLGSPAAAAAPAQPSASCPPESLRRVFAPWLDPARYTLAPGGSFEARTPAWTLAGAQRVAGNERFFVTSGSDVASLRIGPRGQAVSPAVCVGIEHPTVRFFARNVGAATGTLRVDVIVRTPLGTRLAVPIGLVAGDSRWRPTLPMAIGANLTATLSGGRTAVAFRLTAQGAGSAWQVDDFYVDPYRKG